LVLATDGPALALDQVAPPATRIRIVAEPASFADLLVDDRPRVAILAEPPATMAALDAVARERRRRPGLRTIHLSPEASIASRIAALRAGFDDALAQTVDAVELADRAVLLEERSRARSATRFAVAGGYELDLVAHELRLGQQPVHLRPKEFQLLALLAANPGRAYTRRQLLDRVWGPDQVGDPRTVDVHIRWLREKIEPQPNHPLHLVTVRGVGYRLDPSLTEP
jgi:DNA-binding response OmpR family regulator